MPLTITDHPTACAAVFEVLELTERAYGVGVSVPDAIVSTMLLASLHGHRGTEADLDLLITEGVVEASFRVAWRVFTTGDPAAILQPDLQPVRLFDGTGTGLISVAELAAAAADAEELEGVDDARPTGTLVSLGGPDVHPADLPQYLTGPMPILSTHRTEGTPHE